MNRIKIRLEKPGCQLCENLFKKMPIIILINVQKSHLMLVCLFVIKVVQLVVDNCHSDDGEVDGLTDEYAALEILSMVNIGLRSLSKLPSLPKLRNVSPCFFFPQCTTESPHAVSLIDPT